MCAWVCVNCMHRCIHCCGVGDGSYHVRVVLHTQYMGYTSQICMDTEVKCLNTLKNNTGKFDKT